MYLKNGKVYDVLYWIAKYCLPGLTTLLIALGEIWQLPYANQISLTVGAIDTFMLALLGVSKSNYSKAQEEADDDGTVETEAEG